MVDGRIWIDLEARDSVSFLGIRDDSRMRRRRCRERERKKERERQWLAESAKSKLIWSPFCC